jgi:hypothetical protein
MASNSNATASKPAIAAETKVVVAKPGLEKTQIQRDVDALLTGRQI